MAKRVHTIYTRFGDQGQTRLLSGETVAKDDLRVDTYGALDELQSHLGMARALVRQEIFEADALRASRGTFCGRSGIGVDSGLTAPAEAAHHQTGRIGAGSEDRPADRFIWDFTVFRDSRYVA